MFPHVFALGYLALVGATCIAVTWKPIGATRRARGASRRARVTVGLALALILLPLVTPALPAGPLAWLFPTAATAAETVLTPQYVAPAVLPTGQVGIVFRNDAGGGVTETRFKRYFVEYGMDPSVQLSTASPSYPQLAVFQGKTIAAYVDTRGGPNQFQLLFKISNDSGASWAAEYAPFGSETFDSGNSAPLLVASRDGTTLYLFSCCVSSRPQYRSTTDAALATWTTPVAAGDATMRVVTGNNCGNAAAECYRAHTFEFTETATAGNWVYIAKSDSGFGQSGRGTQVGALGGSWSAQVDHGGSGGLSGGGESRATAFVDRSGNIIYVRGGEAGNYLYYKKSTDGGFTWSGQVQAYADNLVTYTVGSPVGLYDPNYSRGEYVWYAGFGGIGAGNDQNTVRVIPLWPAPSLYVDSGSVRLFGSAGGDFDFGTAYPYTFGRRDIPTGIGAYKTSAEDLAIPGRLLNFSFARSYNSADTDVSALGPAWVHGFTWALTEYGANVAIRRGDGRKDVFARQLDLTYLAPPNVFDVLTKNGDSTFTLTLKNQTQYEFSTVGKLTRIHEPAGNQILLNYQAGKLASITDTVGRLITFGYTGGVNLALAKTYTESVAPHPNYPDNGNAELTDGTIGSATSFTDPAWQGHLNLAAPLEQTIDLGSSQPLGLMRSYYYHDPGNGIYKPASVEILTSPDNFTYTSRGSTLAASAVNDTGALWHYDLSLSSVSARYVRFKSTSGGSWLFSTEAQAFMTGAAPLAASAGTNAGASKTYVKSVAASASYPDTGGTELTDGNLGDPNNYGDAAWQGHQNLGGTPLDVTVDLGSAQRVGVVRSYHFQQSGSGIFRPAKIELLTSTDNIQFTSRGATVASSSVNDTGSRWRYEFDLAGVNARYVRFRITTGGEWLFTSETQIFAEGAAPITLPLSYGDRLTSVTDPSTPTARKVSYGYDQNGRLTRVVDKLGNAPGGDPVLHSWHYTYDGASQHIASVVDPDSRTVVTNTYNSEGRLATLKDGVGNTTLFGYAVGQTTVTDPRGHVTTQNFDDRWRLRTQVDVVGASTYTLEYRYEDVYQNVTAVIDRRGAQTDYTYDARGNVLTKTDPQIGVQPRYVTAYQYDAKNNVTQITDARTFTSTFTYDPATNIKTSSTQQLTLAPATYAVTKWEYTDASNPGLATKVISPRGNTTGTPDYAFAQLLTYNSQGNVTQRLDPDGNKTTFGYDGIGRQVSMVDPDGYSPTLDPSHHTWITAYDENDRITESRDPLNHSMFTSYDGAGHRLTLTDRDGNVTTYAYDGAAQLASSTQKPDPVGNPTKVYTTAVTRDGNGNATQVTQDSQGAAGAVTVVTDYGYDAINRLTSVTTHPSAGANLTTTYTLDGNGNATARTSADVPPVVTTYVYDEMSRLSTVSATGLSTITYGYDELSHRTSMIDGTGTSTNSYDGLGRLTQAVQPNGTLGYGYDLDSNRITLTYPTVGSVTYAYSNAGRLNSVTDWATRQSVYSYSAAGQAKTVTVPGSLTTTYGYDFAQRLTTLTNVTPSGTITSDTYTLDNEGNRVAIDELMPAIVSASAKVNSDAGTAVQDHPAIALGNELPNPATYLVWDDQRDGATNSNIYFSRRDPVTGTWSANVKVNTDTGTRNQANPAISMDASSNAYAVWDDFRDGTNNQNIYYSKRTAATGTWLTPNLKVNDGTGNTNERNARIADTAAGVQTAVWVDLRSGQNNIYSSQLNVAGCTNWCANKKVTVDNSTAVKDFPDVAVGADGASYAVWQDSRNGNADIFFSSLTAGGAAWTANVKISDDPGTATQTNGRIGVDAANNLVVAWIDARTAPARVRVARKPFGGAWSASTEISPAPANVQSLSLSVRPDGFAWAVWGDTRAGAANQDIWGSRYDPNTNTWTVPVRLDDDPGTAANQLNPAVAFGPAEVQFAWRDNRASANGDIQSRKVQVLAGMTDHVALSYDGLNRLTKISGPVSENVTLDGPSNITSRTGPAQTDTYDQSNRLTGDGTQSYTWSNTDRLTNRGSDTFGYDPVDRMTSSTVAGSAHTYAYNGDGLLQSRTGSGAATFLWEPMTTPSRLLKQGNDNIVYGLGPLYVIKADTTTLTFARDGSKNVRAELTSSGAVSAAFRYRAYGQIAQSSAAAATYFGFASQLVDPSGLTYMRARWYDAGVGRFLTRDPQRGSAEAPASVNGFNYANGNPLLLSDPSGMAATAGDDAGCGDLCPSDNTSPWQLGVEWLTGTGPR